MENMLVGMRWYHVLSGGWQIWGVAVDMGGRGVGGKGGMYELSEEQQGVGHKLPLLDQDASTLDREG